MELFDEEDEERNEASETILESLIDLHSHHDLIQYRLQLLLQRDSTCGSLAFHNGTEEALFLYLHQLFQNYIPNSTLSCILPDLVLLAVDRYCYSRHWMMHIGDQKGKILDDLMIKLHQDNPINSLLSSSPSSSVPPIPPSADLPPSSPPPSSKILNCVEIGTYCGYSALRIARLFQNPLSRLYCIEINSKCCQWTEKLLTLAGLSDRVVLIRGNCDDGIEFLHQNGIKEIDFLFIDHDKGQYLSDLIKFEESGLLKSPGGIVCADNILSLQQPLSDYIQHVRTAYSPSATPPRLHYHASILYRSCLEYSVADEKAIQPGDYLEDGLEVSIIG